MMMRRSVSQMLMLICMAGALAPLAWYLAGVVAVVLERWWSGRWPSYSDAMFRSHAFLQWMLRSEIGAWIWWCPVLLPLLVGIWLLAAPTEDASGAGVARRFRMIAVTWCGSLSLLMILVWLSPTGVF